MNGNTIESHQKINANNNLTQNLVCLDAAYTRYVAHLLCLCFARVKVDTPPESVNQENTTQTLKRNVTDDGTVPYFLR